MAAPYDIDSMHISEKIATQVGCAAMLTSSANDLQRVFDAYLAEKKRADDAESELKEARKEIQSLRTTIALMNGVQPIQNIYNVERDFVANQTIQQKNERSNE